MYFAHLGAILYINAVNPQQIENTKITLQRILNGVGRRRGRTVRITGPMMA